MRFAFEPMTEASAHALAAWHYPDSYAFYDWVSDPDDLAELLDPLSWEERYWAVRDDRGDLVGFFEFGHDGDTVELGLGLRPDLTGRGLGRSFVLAGMAFARGRFAPAQFRLAVAAFNERAITVYERAGFQACERFIHRTNGGEHPFLRMERRASLP